MISPVGELMGEMIVTAAATNIDRAMPLTVDSAATPSKRKSPCTRLIAMARKGLIKGATSMAPMMMAALFCNNPSAAMVAARVMRTKKSTVGSAA